MAAVVPYRHHMRSGSLRSTRKRRRKTTSSATSTRELTVALWGTKDSLTTQTRTENPHRMG
jgi:hypothetical protein